MTDSKNRDGADEAAQRGILEREGRFWDIQEERIDSLYARPHDWRFVPDLAEKLIEPKVRTLRRIIDSHRSEIGSLLDIGCGNGWFCHATSKRGIRSVGVDLSEKKIETARRMAREQGVADLCHFEACDVTAWRPGQRFDLLTSHGSLHHFPEFERVVPELVERFLRPGGYLLFAEPHHEGMPPRLRDFIVSTAKDPVLGKLFDVEFYLEASGQSAIDVAPPAPAPGEVNIRSESPAGVEFFGTHVDIQAFFRERYEVLEEHFFQYASGHLTNAFYVFMKPALLRGLWRALLPAAIAYDTRVLKKPRYQQHAEEGLWFLRRKGDAAKS